jgi:hypothetical protein
MSSIAEAVSPRRLGITWECVFSVVVMAPLLVTPTTLCKTSTTLRFYQGFVLSMPELRGLMLLLSSDFIV